METEKISSRQLTILTINFTFGTSILVVASLLAIQVKQDAWISSIIGMLVNILMVSLYILLLNMYPGLTLAQMTEVILGKWLGKVISILYVLFFFLLTVYLINLTANFIVTTIFTDTPLIAIHITFTLVVVMAVRYGLEVFSRAAELFAPFIFVCFLFIFIALIPLIDVTKIEPVFEAGIGPILYTGVHFASIQELVCFMMVAPFINRPKQIPKALLLGAGIGGLIIVMVTTISMLVLGPDFSARNLFPAFVLAKKISLGQFLQRVEIIMLAIWFLGVFIKTTVCLFSTVLSLAQTLNMKNYKLYTYPVGILMVVYTSLVYPNVTAYLEFLFETWYLYSYTMMLVIPLLLLVIALIRHWIRKVT
ncbi:GerAB/ArcD/ProY family transporter [Paenibacillus massiliensis]|uniref:GerAB/ArcD/ProY family transporter n=1 Tax=Paenibacillus massiliensis TaxID=225917 RepID=UPI0004231C3C|nr:endospore germination permease [Paenibacillus massiliensis]